MQEMAMWLRLLGAVLITAVVVAALDYFGLRNGWPGGRTDDAPHDAQSRLRELFWFAAFVFVMGMSVVAAVRRWRGQLKRAVVRSERREVR
jgi:purine-cytosine permease-like protein